LNNAAPGAGSGLYLEQAKAANKKTFAGSGKGLARNVGFVAGTTGDFSRIDGRAVVAIWLPKLLPFGGYPGFWPGRRNYTGAGRKRNKQGPFESAITFLNPGYQLLSGSSTKRSIGITKLHWYCGARCA
jgi:hypothetical protein